MPVLLSMSYNEEVIIRATSWTLLHSLWQGLVLALISACILYITKKASSRLRYNLLAVSLLIFLTGIVATFVLQFRNMSEAQMQTSITPLPQPNIVEPAKKTLTINSEDTITNIIINIINTNASLIVLTWLLIIAYKFMRLNAGLYKIHRLKKCGVSSAGDYWNSKLVELCMQLRINKRVQLLESSLIHIPVIIGYFKPVILFPASTLMAMPAQEIEAVLLHELGHIRRGDFLVNIMQNITEIIFFFNPAVLWVSALIKTERENCCDDIALAHTPDKQDYIKALISFQQFTATETQPFAIAFSGEENHLLNRVKRIIYHKNKNLNNMEKKFLSASLILVSVFILALASNKNKHAMKLNASISQPALVSKIQVPVAASNMRSVTEKNFFKLVSDVFDQTTTNASTFITEDSVPIYKIGGKTNMTGVTNTTIDGKEYKIIIENSIVTDMYIDGKKIPVNKIVDYKLTLDSIHSKMVMDSEARHNYSEQVMIDGEQAMRASEQATRDSEQAMRNSEQAIRDREQAMRNREQAMRNSEQAIRASEQAMRDSEQAMRDTKQAQNNMDAIIDELIYEKIIKDKKELKSLQLNATEFIVNGVKQPATIHKKFKDKYVKSETYTMWYETE